MFLGGVLWDNVILEHKAINNLKKHFPGGGVGGYYGIM